MMEYVFIGMGAFTLLYVVSVYNGLVTLRNNVSKAWSDIDVLLKQRYDELPKLVAVCERYLTHEHETLVRVIQARNMASNSSSPERRTTAENEITDALKSLFAVVESYPNLKADQSFQGLQGRVSTLENTVADRREFYNASVNLYNIGIEKMPDAIIAGWLKLSRKQLWQIEPAHREDVKLQFTR